MAIQSQNFTIKNSILKIMLIFLKDNLVILKLITVYGIYFKFFHYKFIFFLIINTGQSVLLKNKIQNINKYTIFISFLIKHAYFLFYNARYYLKLKGLGFSIKYLIKPKHTLLFKLGFSKSRYIQIPKVISIIKKPRKKNIFLYLLA